MNAPKWTQETLTLDAPPNLPKHGTPSTGEGSICNETLKTSRIANLDKVSQ